MNFSTIIAPSAESNNRQESESNERFRPHILWYYLIPVRIVLYLYRKFGHHFGTKAQKIIVIQVTTICEKVSICKGFCSSMLFDTTK